VPWPLGYVQVTERGVRVGARLVPWFPVFDAARADVTMISLYKNYSGVVEVGFSDRLGRLNRVYLCMSMSGDKFLQQLTDLGHPVSTQDRWLRFRSSRQKKGWLPPLEGL
jgi:hypothetical protein